MRPSDPKMGKCSFSGDPFQPSKNYARVSRSGGYRARKTEGASEPNHGPAGFARCAKIIVSPAVRGCVYAINPFLPSLRFADESKASQAGGAQEGEEI